MHLEDPERRIAVLLHEVRSPVAALAAIAEAAGESDTAARLELVRLSLGACAAIERLVTDITVASVRTSSVDVGALVRDAVVARELAGEVIETHMDADLPAVSGDPMRLRQALDNLLNNAVIHGGRSGAVAVTVRKARSRVDVTVSDSGPGIAATELDRIFAVGVRLDSGRRGSGLGLAITRAIVEAHAGSIGVESAPGHGASFTITLPVSDGHPDT